MRKFILTLAAIGFSYIFSSAQQNLFQRTIGGSKSENSYAVERTFDGGYITAGYTTSYGSGKKDALLVKTNGMGQVQWSKAYGGSEDDVAWDVYATKDSGFVVTGTTNSYDSSGDALIFKVDKKGTVEWTRILDSDSVEDGYQIIESFYNNGYYLTGFVQSDSNGTDGFVAKLGSSGNVRWFRRFGSEGDEEAYGIAEDDRGNLIICGMTSYDSVTQGGTTTNPGNTDGFIAKYDSTGNFKWMRTVGTTADEVLWGVTTYRNTYAFTGWSKALSPGDNNVWFMATDTSGSVSANTYLGTNNDDRGFNIEVSHGSTKSYLVTGYADPSGGNREVLIANFSANGSVSSSNLFGESDRDGHWPTDITQSRDGGYVILSTSRSFNSNSDDDFYLIKTGSNIRSSCNEVQEVLRSLTGQTRSVSFGKSYNNTWNRPVSLTTTTVSSIGDSTLCCSITVDLPKDTVSLCAGGGINIGIAGTNGVKYTWTDATGKVISSIPNPRVSPSTTTTYKVVASSSDGQCNSDSATITVVVNQYLTDDWARDTSFCSGDSVFVTGSSQLISFNWVGKHVNSNNQTIKVKKSDTIYFSGIDVNSCGYRDTMIVMAFDLPTFSLGKDTTICDSEAITLSGPSGMTSYNWNNGAGSNQTYTTSTEQTHTLVVVDGNGCKASDDIKVFTNPSSSFSLGADDTFCVGSTYTILGPGFLTNYYWNDTASSLQNLPVSEAGTYHLKAFNSFGCPSFDTITLYTYDQPTFDLGDETKLCGSNSKYIVGPSGMASYKWSTNETTDSIRVTTPGIVWLRVFDTNGCSFTDSTDVSRVSNPTISLGSDTTICDTDSLVLSPGSAFVSYTWSTNESTASITVKDKGTYSVTIIDTNGCAASASMDLDTIDCGNGSISNILITGVKVFPNPATTSVTVEFHSQLTGKAKVSIVDAVGKELYTEDSNLHLGNNTFNLNTDFLNSGNYFIVLNTKNGSATFKLLIQ